MPKRSQATTDGAVSVRTVSVRLDTVNEDDRSVEAVLATEGQLPTISFDLRSGRKSVTDQVWLMDGGEVPSQIPLVDSHPEMRGEVTGDHVRGSVRSLRIENGQLIGRLHFADDPTSLSLWGKYRDGHMDSVSPTIDPMRVETVNPRRERNIAGRMFRAGNRVLDVIMRWRPRLVSTVLRPADPVAKVRTSDQEPDSMNERLRKFLESVGLRSDATDEQTQQFVDLQSGRTVDIARLLESESDTETSTVAVRAGLRALGVDPDDPSKTLPDENAGQGTASRAEAGDGDGGETGESERATVDPAAIRAEERERVAMIDRVGRQDLTQEVRAQAVREGWDEARVSGAALQAVRSNRSDSVGPAIHSRSHEGDCTREALGAAIMIREGLDPVDDYAHFREGVLIARREGEPNDRLVQAAERGWVYRDWSLVEICREACRLDGITAPTGRLEMIRAAVSGSALTNIFSTSVNAQLLSGYTDYGDSTDGWTSTAEVPNFQTNERMMMGKFGALKRLARGKTAEHLDESDSKEEYKIARYAGQFVVDDQDIIDDRLGAVDQVSPRDIGGTAAQLRPNLVYAILLANAALADTGALFNNTAETTTGGHTNLLTDAYDAAGMQAGLLAMAKHRIRKRPLNIRPRFILAPMDIRFAVLVSLKSASRDYDSTEGIYNPLADLGIEPRFDDRLGVGGVIDPVTEIAYPGTATNWFLAARPGENGAKTIEVGYLRGTGRAPQIRSFVQTQGQWGIGWDINLDIGGKALDFRALQKSTGAA